MTLNISLENILSPLWRYHQKTLEVNLTEFTKKSLEYCNGRFEDRPRINRGMYTSFDLRVDFYGDEFTCPFPTNDDYAPEKSGVQLNIEFIHFGNTTVLMRVKDGDDNRPEFQLDGSMSKDWECIASHDSCWRYINSSVEEVLTAAKKYVIKNYTSLDPENYEAQDKTSVHFSFGGLCLPAIVPVFIAFEYRDHDYKVIAAVDTTPTIISYYSTPFNKIVAGCSEFRQLYDKQLEEVRLNK